MSISLTNGMKNALSSLNNLQSQMQTTNNRLATGKKVKKAGGGSRNPFTFVVNYIRQVIAELRKVIWPNRKQMVNYTIVVLLFLAFMTTLIGLVDLGLAKLVLWVFG